jgi:hypothetical protein
VHLRHGALTGAPAEAAGMFRGAPMNPTTLKALAQFPQQLEAFYAAVPYEYKLWAPPSWEGIPSEHFTALEQVCHVRDIEIEGYQVRIDRLLRDEHPFLPSIDSYELARERDYPASSAAEALELFRKERAETVEILADLTSDQLGRTGEFEGYGPVTVRSLAHFLLSHDHQHLAGLQWLLGKISALSKP